MASKHTAGSVESGNLSQLKTSLKPKPLITNSWHVEATDRQKVRQGGRMAPLAPQGGSRMAQEYSRARGEQLDLTMTSLKNGRDALCSSWAVLSLAQLGRAVRA